MAVAWSWAFGPETSTTLLSLGFSFLNSYFFTPRSTAEAVYTYTGSPTRWSVELGNSGFVPNVINFPSSGGANVNQGWLAAPFKLRAGVNIDTPQQPKLLHVTGNGRFTYIQPSNSVGPACTLSLYVDSVFKETTLASFDFSLWKYLALKFDLSGATHYGQIWVDGVAVTAYQSGAAVAASSVTITAQGLSAGNTTTIGTYLGQVILYDDPADAGQAPRFVTRVEPNADGTDVGTWTPTGAATDWQAVDSPFDAATYTEDAAASTGDRVQVLTSGGGSDLATALGTTPTVIDAVTHHNGSSGASVSAKAVIGDGTSETSGSSSVIGPSTTYLYVTAATKPSSGAWTGTDAPTLVYEVV